MQSETIGKLADALAKAQATIKGAKKDETNPHYKNKYADLASVWDACRDPLTKNGLSIVQSTRILENGAMVVVTTLLHSSGEWMRGEYLLNPTKTDPQGFGSAMTYARRYSLSAMAGIAPEDDDGEAATNRNERSASNDRPPPDDRRDETDREAEARAEYVRIAKGIKAAQSTKQLSGLFAAEADALALIASVSQERRKELGTMADRREAELMDAAAAA